ncbi:hypothetical protein SM764_04110 [Pseudophaeobacter sp. 1A16562]|uniref:hypothetical protein n=1 Tax=Pseudophaeobacter sp. 1A16562 TaxID=3098143 RepID=UPI0034D5A7F1
MATISEAGPELEFRNLIQRFWLFWQRGQTVAILKISDPHTAQGLHKISDLAVGEVSPLEGLMGGFSTSLLMMHKALKPDEESVL